MKQIIFGAFTLLIFIGLIWAGAYYWSNSQGLNISSGGSDVITNFEECAAAGNPVMESYPRQCRTLGGKHFVEDVSGDVLPDVLDPVSPKPRRDCFASGCSGQVCADRDVITTCEYMPEYACYQNAVCERQSTGECGWTETEALLRCINEAQFETGI